MGGAVVTDDAEKDGRYVFLVLLQVQPAWLRLDRSARNGKADAVRAIVGRHRAVAVRWLDAEAFASGCTDVLLVETADPWAWYRCWEEVRDTELFSTPYFVVERIVTTVEDGYQRYERELVPDS